MKTNYLNVNNICETLTFPRNRRKKKKTQENKDCNSDEKENKKEKNLYKNYKISQSSRQLCPGDNYKKRDKK